MLRSLLAPFLFGLALEGDPDVLRGPLPLGEELLSELACTACHAAEPATVARLAPKAGPRLEEVGARLAPAALRRFLARPHAERPGTTMPDLLGGMAGGERREVVEALTHWLVSRAGPIDGTPTSATAGQVERGRQLYHSVGCVACHAPQEPEWALAFGFWDLDHDGDVQEQAEELYVPPGTLPPRAVPLGNLAARTTVGALSQFLLDPLALRPSGRMPSLSLTREEAHAIALYLLRDQAFDAARPLPTRPGLAFERFEGRLERADFGDLRPVERGVALDLESLPEHPEDHFGFRFEGFLDVAEAGTYGFATTSDDGSLLYLDGELLIDNDGQHSMDQERGERWLEEGRHGLVLAYFEHAGEQGLEVRWKGPGFDWSPLPAELLSHGTLEYELRLRRFELDPELAAAGQEHFERLGCAACHAPERSAPAAPALAHLDPTRGCLAEKPFAPAASYDLAPAERAALAESLTAVSRLARPLEPRVAAGHVLTRFGCYACHRREGIGGVHPERSPYFRAEIELDLGNEGRLPPHLEGVGAKLRAEWLAAVLEDPQARVRPYLATRMPVYGAANLAGLAEALATVDATPAGDVEPPYSEAAAAAGRELVGTRGLGCIQCHTFGGYRSLGIPAVDLAHVHERIRPGWFRTLLLNPRAVDMSSRMPAFWDATGRSPVKGVLDGDPALQSDAIRSYLSLGAAMPLPEGLVAEDSEYELVPVEGPVMVAVFLKDVGPRVLLVGSPELVHYAFDVESSTLTHAWRGRFFNAEGTWHGRAGALEEIPRELSLALPLSAPLARLEALDAPWPWERGRSAGIRPLGRRIGADGLPRWRYALGGLEVEDFPRAFLVDGEAGRLRRTLSLSAPVLPSGYALLVARGETIAPLASGSFAVDAARVDLGLFAGAEALVRAREGGAELIVLLAPPGATRDQAWDAVLEIDYRW